MSALLETIVFTLLLSTYSAQLKLDNSIQIFVYLRVFTDFYRVMHQHLRVFRAQLTCLVTVYQFIHAG